MNKNSDVYNLVKRLNNLRTSSSIWNTPQVQRFADNDIYAFTRGNIFAAFTNRDFDINKTITYHPYPNGSRLCNIFDNKDVVTVNNNQFNISLRGGNFKVYNLCTSSQNIKESLEFLA